jgi:hypothetical protein
VCLQVRFIEAVHVAVVQEAACVAISGEGGCQVPRGCGTTTAPWVTNIQMLTVLTPAKSDVVEFMTSNILSSVLL